MTVRLGILDWGIGGLDFYARLRAAHPSVPVTYWSDAGTTPYGKQPTAALAARVEAVARDLQRRGVTHFVVACNAASTVLTDPRLRALERAGLPISGVIAPAIAAALADPARTLGVVGGRRTIASQAYRRGLAVGGRRVIQRVAQPLSALVERGVVDGPEVDAAVARIFAPLRRVDRLVLACTHYTALLPSIRAALPDVSIVDPAAATLAHVTRAWHLDHSGPPPLRGGEHSPAPSDMFLTTGDPKAMRRAARLAFGVALTAVEAVPLRAERPPPRAPCD